MLLKLDGLVNLLLGAVLVAAPMGSLSWLGLPDAGMRFYPSILGAVLFGIGLALLFEAKRGTTRRPGLGIAGAVLINFCGSLVLLGWLVFGRLDIPARGRAILWVVAVGVLAIGLSELRRGAFRRNVRRD
jgi:hypothetical protein